ncbi:micro-fibrillar-associated protein 1 [Apodospora peruviana]|uniref:Micro-fibrillar-associated protein 1 n=1 Tax=Apodospora peruviana TaxID=516989 RepID=A0AAE0MD39_9PEZI|nr:micro-fibrillar-associated protein 1 [Apodospora peruviana]
MPPPKRMTANPVKPARYFPGKPAAPELSSESEGEDGSDQEDEATTKNKPQRKIAPPPKFKSAAPSGPGKVISRGDNAKINLKGALLDDEEEEKKKKRAAQAARIAAELKAKEEGFVTEDEEELESGSGSEEEESSSEEEEEEEEEEAPRRLMMRPKFIPKSARTGTNQKSTTAEEQEEVAAAAAEKEEEARRKAADEMVEEQIKKDIAARAAGKKHWDDDTDPEEDVIDDTDDIDPEAEYAAWKLRELKRIRREREAIEAKEKELAEIERRRNLTEDERRAEDEAHIAQQKEEKEGRGKMGYMQKYFHKGAFYQEESKELGLDRRDIMGATFADDVRNREILPKALQLRDMTKLGKKGATKYRDLKSEDTGSWGGMQGRRREWGDDRFGFGGVTDERFQPDRDRDRGGYRGEDDSGPKGSNAIPLGDRKPRDAPQGPRGGEDRYRRDREGGDSRDSRDRYDDRDRVRDRDRRRDDDRRQRSPSRSRSPRRDSGGRDRRKRSPSSPRERDRDSRDRRYDGGEKRRRVDTR